jgi:hypothetical protein
MGTPGHCRDGVRGERESARGTRRDRRGRARDARLPAIALCFALILVAAGCGGSKKAVPAPAPRPPEIDFTVIDSPSLQFLPRHQEAPGWRLEEDPLVVPGERLATYMGAVAPEFTRYALIDITAGKYAATTGAGFANVEIFRFPDFVKAFGAYSMRKDAARRYVPINNEAYVSKYAVHVWRGPFYIRVTGGAQNAFQALTGLASFVADRMPEAPSKPAVFNFFPVDTRVAADRGFGQPLLGNSFQASFNIGGDIMEGLIIPAANKATAAKILDQYRGLYVRNGKLLDPIPNLGEDNFTAEDRYLGRAVAFRLDRFVIAFNGYKERQKLVDLAVATDARILGSIRKQLVKADEQAEASTRPERPNDNRPPWQRGQ